MLNLIQHLLCHIFQAEDSESSLLAFLPSCLRVASAKQGA